MENKTDMNIANMFLRLREIFDKTTKKQVISFVVITVLLIVTVFVGKNFWKKYKIVKQAENLVSKISQSERDFFKINGRYREDIFRDRKLAKEISITASPDSSSGQEKSRRKKLTSSGGSRHDSYDMGYSGDFYIQINAENACLILKYKKNTYEKTTFYAAFDKDKVFCQGTNCLKESSNTNDELCYTDGDCFAAKQTLETQRVCGDGNGTQKRECSPSCEGGKCSDWQECVCKKGFEWDGKTCKQMQTEKDCTQDQCFNGVYCEDREPIIKSINDGSCKRIASCQKSGWNYSPWNCSCNNDDLCSLNEQCVPYPGNKDKISLPDGKGSCTNVYYTCKKGLGWIAKAGNCVCGKIGTFWDAQKSEAKCSDCTKKPAGATFTSVGGNKDECAWKCSEGFQNRRGTCVKPNGQYLCVMTGSQTCTDDFSKNRKIRIDEPTNEGLPCFTEDQEHILFYDKKNQRCQICQCVDLRTGRISR